jgi:DNA gyrase subunit A
VKVTEGARDVILTTEKGMSVRFDEKHLRELGRATRGVRGITLRGEDKLQSLAIVDESATFLVCTENGYGKRTGFDEYRETNRGVVGIIAIRTSERNGKVVSAATVREVDSLMLITANGMMIRMAVADISVIGRATQGVRLINLDEGDKLVSATLIETEDEDVEEAAATTNEPARPAPPVEFPAPESP